MELGAFRRVRRVGAAVLLGGVLGLPVALIGTLPAYAANVVVSSGADSGPGTLRDVVAAASPGDIITFTVPTVTLTTAPITVNKNLTIRGNGPGATQITRSGAAFRIFDVTAGVTVTIDLLRITGGAGTGGGGVRNNGTLNLTRSVLDSNNTTGDGGAILNRPGATATVTNTRIELNSVNAVAAARGGGVANAGTLNISNSAVAGNSVNGGPFAGGGGIANLTGGTLTVLDTDINANLASSATAQAAGGGVLHESATTLSLTNSLVNGNSASGTPAQGAGLALAGPANVARVSVLNNITSGSGNRLGGGIHVSGNNVTVTNATVAGNTATHGGGLFKGGPGAAVLSNSTVAGNTTSVGAAVQAEGAGSLSVQSTIVANQVSGPNCAGGITDSGNNLQFGDNTCPGFTVADPLLNPLTFNGGVSQTMALGAGSPAIDTGNCPAAPTDQRGFPRVGPCDIGAYEFGAAIPDSTPPACAVVGVLGTNPKQMDVSVTDSGRGLLVIINVSVTNGTVVVPYFLPRSTLPTVLTAVKTNQAAPTSWAFDALDDVGNVRHCA